MIRKSIILLSLCLAVLCAFVCYMSHQAMQTSVEVEQPPEPFRCAELLDAKPLRDSRLLLTEFATGRHLATIDSNNDGEWDQLFVPFFAKTKLKAGLSYTAVLVSFKDVKTYEDLDAIIATKAIDADYWQQRQELPPAIYSQLALEYKNLDIANSPILYCGFDSANPLLGEATMLASGGLGAFAVLVGLVAMLAGLFVRKPKSPAMELTDEVLNGRSHIDADEGKSIFDEATSMREQQPLV